MAAPRVLPGPTSPSGLRQPLLLTALGLALALGVWLLRRDGTFDTYRVPLFWPFLFTAGIVTALSTTELAEDVRGWWVFALRIAVASGLVMAVFARIAAANPINNVLRRDVAGLALLAALLAVAGAAATCAGARWSPAPWMRTGWCVAACLLTLAAIPFLALTIHCSSGSCL